MIIFVGSFPGTETKKLCKTLALRLGLRHLSKEEFEKNSEKSEELKQKVQAEEKKGNFITDSAIAGKTLQNPVRIFLNSAKRVRAKQVAESEKITLPAALEKIEEEEKSTGKKLSAISGSEIFNPEEFDFMLNVDKLSEEATIALIEKFLEKIRK